MTKRTKIHYCQECQEMVFHTTDEHDEAMSNEYESWRQEEATGGLVHRVDRIGERIFV